MQDKRIGRRHALKYFGLISATAAGREFLADWLPQGSKLMASPGPSMPGAQQSAVDEPRPSMPGAQQSAVDEPRPSPADTESPYVPRFFKPAEFQTVGILSELILPSDDRPGAKEAKVANYIDFIVFSASEFEPSLQKQWIDGLAQLDQLSGRKYGSPFSKLSSSQREALLTEMSAPEHDPRAKHPGFAFYKLLKSMTLEAFFTSKVGLIDFLEYKGLAFLTSFPGCTHPEHLK